VSEVTVFKLLGASAFMMYLPVDFRNFSGPYAARSQENTFKVMVESFLIVDLECLAAGLHFAVKR
jgi:hypothetical protein